MAKETPMDGVAALRRGGRSGPADYRSSVRFALAPGRLRATARLPLVAASGTGRQPALSSVSAPSDGADSSDPSAGSVVVCGSASPVGSVAPSAGSAGDSGIASGASTPVALAGSASGSGSGSAAGAATSASADPSLVSASASGAAPVAL